MLNMQTGALSAQLCCEPQQQRQSSAILTSQEAQEQLITLATTLPVQLM